MTLAPNAPPATACAHCLLPVPAGLVVSGEERQFCCSGCRAVHRAIDACGLGNFYRLRDTAQLSPARPGQSTFAAFDAPAFQDLYVRTEGGHLRSADLYLEGVTCAACIWLLEKLPEVHAGVVDARLGLARATLRVTWDDRATSLSRIARALDGFGHAPHPAKGVRRESMYRREFRSRIAKLGVAGAIAGNLMLLAAALYAGWAGGMDGPCALLLRWVSLALGVTALAWPGAEFFRGALASLRARTVNLDVPIAIALLAGGVAGTANVLLDRGEIYFDSLATLVFLLLVGRLLQFRQQRRAADAVELLFSLTPSTCRVVGPGGETSEQPVESLKPGDVVEVLPGQLLPADGAVDRGSSAVDEALLTGESAPRTVRPGDPVFGGSQNGPSVLRVRIAALGEASRVGQLMRLLERGLADKPEIVRFSDRVGVAFTFAVTLLAAATFACWVRFGLAGAVDNTVAFLIVTCPCVLGLAAPMTLSVAIGQLARRHVLVKSAGALEKLARGGPLLLDKTGTLTEGRLRVVSYEGDPDLRGLIARLERSSSHPVARALVAAYGSVEPPAHLRGQISDFQERHDGGIAARLGPRRCLIGSPAFLALHGVPSPDRAPSPKHTPVLVALDGQLRARVLLADQLRPATAGALRSLRALGFDPEIWSGDARGVVSSLARDLGIPPERAHGAASPEAKLAAVRAASPAVMVGDGINDAPALAAASVGIAVHGGAEASLLAADVYVARPGLAPVVDLVRTARHTLRVIRGNFCVSLAYNLVAGTLAATGHMNPLIAAILMPLSSATVLSLAVMLVGRRTREFR